MDEEFELPDRSYSVSDIQEYFLYNSKMYKTWREKSVIQIYVNKIQNRIASKIKTWYYFKLLKSKTKKKKLWQKRYVLQLKIRELMLVHCNILINQYQRDSKVLCTFFPNKSFCHLQSISPTKIIFSPKYFIQSFHTMKYGLLIKDLTLIINDQDI